MLRALRHSPLFTLATHSLRAVVLSVFAIHGSAFAAAKPAPLRIVVYSHWGMEDREIAHHAEYSVNDGVATHHRSGTVTKHGYIPRKGVAPHFMFNLQPADFRPEVCSDVAAANQQLPLREMVRRGILTDAMVEEVVAALREVDPRQVTFVEVKREFRGELETLAGDANDYQLDEASILIRKVEDYLGAFNFNSIPIGDEAAPPAVPAHPPEPELHFKRDDTRNIYWKKVGTIMVVSGQRNGKWTDLPVETQKILPADVIPNIRKTHPYLWEAGRASAIDQFHLPDILPVMIQRVLKEAIAMGAPLDQVSIVAHSISPLHALLYERYGGVVRWSEGINTVLQLDLLPLMARFPPESLGLPAISRVAGMVAARPLYALKVKSGVQDHASIALRIFAEAWRDGQSVNPEVRAELAARTFDFRMGELVRIRFGEPAFRTIAIPRKYLIASRDGDGSFLFDRNGYFRDERAVAVHPGETIRDLAALERNFRAAALGLFSALRNRGVDDPVVWLRLHQIQLVYSSNDPKRIAEMVTPESKENFGHHSLEVRNTVVWVKPMPAFLAPIQTIHPGLAYVFGDAAKYLEAELRKRGGPAAAEKNSTLLPLEDLIRSEADLD